MKLNLLIAVLLLLPGVPLGAQESGVVVEEVAPDDPNQPVSWYLPAELPAAQDLLADVRRALPAEPLRIEAELQSKDHLGHLEKKLFADILLHWTPPRPWADYHLRDAFGDPIESVRVTYGRDGATWSYLDDGAPRAGGEAPDPRQLVQDTDMTWSDLALAFLWWPGGETVGGEKVKGRFCYILELPAPGPDGPVAGVRLWVESKVHVLMQAESYDQDGEPIRRLTVRSLRRVDDLWVVKDLAVRSYPSKHKTLLRVKSVQREGGLEPPEAAQAL